MGILARTVVVLGLAVSVASGQLSATRMMKIVTRDTSPDTPRQSFAAKPKTLYRMGEAYGRIEELPDPEHGVHGLVVVAEPKIWMINLLGRTGQLYIDPGPTFVLRASIIPGEPNQKPPLPDFEFGREYDFLRQHKATASRQVVDGKTYDALSLTLQGYTIVLISQPGRQQPWRVAVSRKGAVLCQYDYDEYKTDLEPKMDLFKPPSDIAITQAAQP